MQNNIIIRNNFSAYH